MGASVSRNSLQCIHLHIICCAGIQILLRLRNFPAVLKINADVLNVIERFARGLSGLVLQRIVGGIKDISVCPRRRILVLRLLALLVLLNDDSTEFRFEPFSRFQADILLLLLSLLLLRAGFLRYGLLLNQAIRSGGLALMRALFLRLGWLVDLLRELGYGQLALG